MRANALLDEAELKYTIELAEDQDPLTREARQTPVLLSDSAGVRVRSAEVGYGIRQLIPIAVELAEAVGRGTSTSPMFAVQQPELHVHPKLQGNVFEMLIEVAKLEPTGRGALILVETHSENISLRLQKLIRRSDVRPGGCVIHFDEIR
jgi:predicted ATPase